MRISTRQSLLLIAALVLTANHLAHAASADAGMYADAAEIRASLLGLESKDSIHRQMTQCLKNSPDAIGAGQCYGRAYVAYDALLDKVYQLALSSLSPSSQETLRSSQKKWRMFRDEEAKLYSQDWGYSPGTVIKIAIPEHRVQMVRERIAELTMYSHFDEQ